MLNKRRVLMILENCSYLNDARVGKEAKTLQSAGYEVSVISPERFRFPTRTVVEGITIYGFPRCMFIGGTFGYFIEYVCAALAIIVVTAYIWLSQGFDILHIANPPDCMVPVLTIYKLFGTRIIYDQHDLSPELYQIRFAHPRMFLSKVQLFLERLSYRLADHTIVTNESYRSVAIRRGRCDSARVTVVRNGPELDLVNSAEIDGSLRSKSPHIIAFGGVTGYQDGLDHLCQSLYQLRFDLKRNDFLCIVLGDGDALNEIKTLSQELGIDQNIWFAGWINDPRLYFRYLLTADICVAPEPSNCYNDRSTFVKVTEYMAAAKPIVAFDLPETRFSAGPAAVYATPNDDRAFADSLAKLMDNPGLCAVMGECGRKRIETKLSWQHSIPALLRVYRRFEPPEGGIESRHRAASAAGS